MKNSDSANQNISLQLTQLNLINKFISSDSVMAVSNTNTNSVVISSVLPTSIHQTQALPNISRSINEVKTCNFILAKGQPTSSSIMNQITLNPQNPTIKLVNLSKCQSINKDANIVPNNAISLQILTPSQNSVTTTSVSDLNVNSTKSDNSTSVTGSLSNIPITNATSNSRNRLILQSPQSHFIPNTIAIIPQNSELSNNSSLSSPVLKPSQVIVKGKHANPAIRPIITQANVAKQQYNIISPTKPLTNLSQITTVSMAENSNNIQDSVTIRRPQLSNENDKNQKSTPVKLHHPTNIRLALTRNIPNKVQVISPKSRKRASTPVKLVQDCRMSDNLKDDCGGNIMNSLQDNGNYSPTRKRARKQHLKSVATKSQKLNTKLPSSTRLNDNSQITSTNLNSIRPSLTEKPTTLTSISNKLPIPAKPHEDQKSSPSSITCTPNLTSPIFIELKNPTHHISSSNNIPASNNITKTSNATNLIQRPTSIYPNNNSNISSTPASVQIITSNSSSKQIQLSPSSTNILLSNHKSGVNNKTNLSANTPPKIYHISQCSNINSRITKINKTEQIHPPPNINSTTSPSPNSFINQTPVIKEINSPSLSNNLSHGLKHNKNPNNLHATSCTLAASNSSNLDLQNKVKKLVKDIIPAINLKTESKTDSIKMESTTLIPHLSNNATNPSSKLSIYPHKYNWNSRRYHFEKKSDVKLRKIRANQTKNSSYSNSNLDKDTSGSEVEINDTSWFLYKASNQILQQKNFDCENVEKFLHIKQTLVDSSINQSNVELNEPSFKDICQSLCHNHSSISLLPNSSLDSTDSLYNADDIKEYLDPSLFGIDEIIHNSINTFYDSCSTNLYNNTENNNVHICSNSCKYYSSQISRSVFSPETLKILDLLEGLIVKENRLIEKESEIHNQCQALLSNNNSKQNRPSSTFYYDFPRCDPDLSSIPEATTTQNNSSKIYNSKKR